MLEPKFHLSNSKNKDLLYNCILDKPIHSIDPWTTCSWVRSKRVNRKPIILILSDYIAYFFFLLAQPKLNNWWKVWLVSGTRTETSELRLTSMFTCPMTYLSTILLQEIWEEFSEIIEVWTHSLFKDLLKYGRNTIILWPFNFGVQRGGFKLHPRCWFFKPWPFII